MCFSICMNKAGFQYCDLFENFVSRECGHWPCAFVYKDRFVGAMRQAIIVAVCSRVYLIILYDF
jgi:hypothetical protein